MVGCVLGNEFLDALPVHRLVKQNGEWRELLVDWSAGRFVELPGDLTDERLRLAAEAAATLPDGHLIEVNLRMAEWLTNIASDLERGFVLLFDYGLPRTELWSAQRATGTLRAFRGQHVSSDILGGVGHQDITAHVDLDGLAEDAAVAGLEVLGRTTQAEFLMGNGFEEVYASARDEADHDWQPALELRSAVRRLLDPHHLGAYAAVVLGKSVPAEPPLRGIGYRVSRPG
jgi:SAM-dependent MidA family methyltransferase